MQNQETGGRFRRLTSRLKGREIPSPATSPTSSQDNPASEAVDDDYNDRQKALNRYRTAADQLKEAIKIRKGHWGSFDFEELSGKPEGFNDLQFKNKINGILILRETSIENIKGWSKFMYAVECVLTTFSPFAKNFLMDAKDAQSVMPSTCLIFILFIV